MSFTMNPNSIFDSKTQSLVSENVNKLVMPAILNTANVRSFAAYLEEKVKEDESLNETMRSEDFQKDRELWEKYTS